VKQLSPNPDACRLLSDAEMARLKSSDLTHWPNPDHGCLTCGDHKVFTTPSGEQYECDCMQQWILYHWLLNAGIVKEYQRLSWADLTQVKEEAQLAVIKWVENLEYNVRVGRGLILWSGGTGTGKTLLATLALKRVLSEGYDGYFTTFIEMISTFTAGWRDEDERSWFIKRIRNVPILVVDDIGKEAKGASNMVDSMFDMVMRYRVSAGLPTIITTNLEPSDIKSGYGRFVMSLLSEQCELVEVPGSDYRGVKSEEKKQEAIEQTVRPLVVR
jgi:DNA replication protein DnaC